MRSTSANRGLPVVAVSSVHGQRVLNDAYGTVDFVAENVGVACMAGRVGQAMDDDVEYGHRTVSSHHGT